MCSGEGVREGKVAVVGFYGSRLRVGCGSMGGWDSFGPDRLVTRSRANVLYELDGQSALSLYKEYLGEHAAHLPASGLLFPLSVRGDGAEAGDEGLVRTILSVNEAEQSMTFAGDITQGTHARLMRATFERLIDGAREAAQISRQPLGDAEPRLAVLISCVGKSWSSSSGSRTAPSTAFSPHSMVCWQHSIAWFMLRQPIKKSTWVAGIISVIGTVLLVCVSSIGGWRGTLIAFLGGVFFSRFTSSSPRSVRSKKISPTPGRSSP